MSPLGSVGSSSGVLDADRSGVGRGRVPAEHHLVVGPAGHDPGRDHHAVVLQPQCVGLAVGCVRHVLGLQDRLVLALGPDQGRRRATVEVDRDALGVGRREHLRVLTALRRRRSSAARRSPRSRSRRPPQRPRERAGVDRRRRGPRCVTVAPTGGGSGRTPAMSARTRSRSCADGAVTVVSARSDAGLLQRVDLAAAGRALGQVPLELCAFDVIERVDRIGPRQRVDVAGHEPTPMVSRSLMSPSLMRVLAVPTGSSSMVATSVCV